MSVYEDGLDSLPADARFVGKLSPSDLLSQLSEQQRKEFAEIMKDPRRAEMLATSDEDERQPWWKQGELIADEAVMLRPVPLPQDQLLSVKPGARPALEYNIVAAM